MTLNLPTVVVVDDAPEVRMLVKTRLRLSGSFEVVGEGGTGLDAIELARSLKPDVIVLDVSMPEMDGLQALPRALEVSPGSCIVLYSGFDEQGLVAHARELGAAGFIEKSSQIDGLAEQILAIMASHADGTFAATEREVPATVTHLAPAEGEESVLLEHLERFREVFQEAAIGMATLTLTGQIVRSNGALDELFREHAGTLVGTPYSARAASTADGLRLTEAIEDLAAGKAPALQVDHAVSTAQGERRVRTTLVAVRGAQGRALYLFLQVQDVTEQQRATEELRQSEERFRLLVDAVEDYAIFMLDPGGRVASWNAGAQRIKGYREQEVLGKHFSLFYPEDKKRERHPEHELELALRDGHYEEEGWRLRSDGTRFWANVVITAIRNDQGEHLGFAKVTRDITARQRTLEERTRAADALAIANDELESMNARLARAAADQSHFLAVTAHELRGPVGVLGGSADTLAAHWAELTDDERAEMFDGMATSAARLRRLLGDLLTATRLEAGVIEFTMRPVPVSRLVQAAAGAVTRAHPEVVLFVDCPDDVEVTADFDRAAQALENVLSNAIVHGKAPLGVAVSRVPSAVEVRISDAGPGVPFSVQDRLFERFATGDTRGGTGLGLFIVRALMRAQGGDAHYEAGDSQRDHAFVLTFLLP